MDYETIHLDLAGAVGQGAAYHHVQRVPDVAQAIADVDDIGSRGLLERGDEGG